MDDVGLFVRQGSRSYPLGSEDAGVAADNELGQITWQVTLPDALRTGPALLVADTARLPVTIAR